MGSYLRRLGPFLLLLLSCWLLSLSSFSVPAAAQPTGYQEYYVLGYEEHIWQAFLGIYDGPDGDIFNRICSTVSLVATADNQVIYYDHWEDGYEPDLLNPVQSTTITDTLNAGDVLLLNSDQSTGPQIHRYVPVPRDPADLRYDGGDRVLSSGGPVGLTHAMWPLDESWIGGAWEIYAKQAYAQAYSYRLPIGEDLYAFGGGNDGAYGDLRNVYLQLQAFDDNTTISIENGADVVNLTLDRGQTYFSLGYVDSSLAPAIDINSGTWIRSNKPTQVGLVTGADSPSGQFQSRFLLVLPNRAWGADYVVPVPSGNPADDAAEVYLFNPNDFPIEIQAYDAEIQTSFRISSTEYISAAVPYSNKRAGLGYVPQDSAARFTSQDGVFGIAVCADTSNAQYDWGFSGIPSKYLTQDYYVSWAPGSFNTPPTDNGSPVWVTPLANDTDFYVDFSPLDGQVDLSFGLDALQQQRIFDPDSDNTGMHIWATGQFAVVWGEDPRTAGPSPPYLDLGVATLPVNQRWLDPVLTLDKEAEPTILSPGGGVVTFTLVAQSYNVPLVNVNVSDTLPLNWTYLPGSTTVIYPNGTPSNPEPQINGRRLFWDLATNLEFDQRLTLTFQAQITQTGLPLSPYAGDELAQVQAISSISVNRGGASGRHEFSGNLFYPTDEANVYIGPLDLNKSVNNSKARIGDTLVYTLTYANVSPSLTVTDTFLRDAVPIQYVTFLSASDSGVYDGASGTISWTLGSLAPGASDYVTFSVEVNDFVESDTVIENVAFIGNPYMIPLGSNVARTTILAPNIPFTKSGPTVAGEGQAITYTLAYENDGGVEATEVLVWDTIPYSTTYVPGSLAILTDTEWTRLTDLPGDDQGAFISPSLIITPGSTPGTLDVGETGQIRFSVQVQDELPAGSRILNNGTLDRKLDIPRDSNTVVTRISDLIIQKSAEQAVVAPGDVIDYHLTYSNHSTAVSQTNVYVREPMPDYTCFITASGGDLIEYSWDNGVTWTTTLPITRLTHVRWYDAALPPDSQEQTTFSVYVNDALPEGSTIRNLAHITSTETAGYIQEWIPSNQIEVETVDLWLRKRADRYAVWNGELLTYTLTYGNYGSADIDDVLLLDTVPLSTTYVPDSIWGRGADDSGAPNLLWKLGPVTAGTSAEAGFVVKIGDDLPRGSLITNTAVLSNPLGPITSDPAVSVVNLFSVITGTVFEDSNGDGLQNGGEGGIPGVILTLDGQVTVTTGLDGGYALSVTADSYHTLVQSDLPGYFSTTPNTITLNVSLDTDYEINFGDALTTSGFAAVYGVVFEDLNGNGRQDANESGLPHVSLSLDGLTSTSTDLYGSYTLSTTLAGTHTVVESDPPSYFSTTPNTITLGVEPGNGYPVGFGDAPNELGFVSLFGVVFEDRNGNGRQDEGEIGLPGVTVTFDQAQTEVTDRYGVYTFSTNQVGVHNLVERDPPGYFSTSPNTVTLNVVLQQGHQVDFGDASDDSGFAAIYGSVFNDVDGDGAWDLDETGIIDVPVSLDGITSTLSSLYGAYTLSTTQPGPHVVREADLPYYRSTTSNTVQVDVALNQGFMVNFGDQPLSTIEGIVFEDRNGNGLQETGEAGLPGVTVSLDNGAVVTTTDANGQYFFAVQDGVHVVAETDPSDYFSTTPNTVTVRADWSNPLTVDFGDVPQEGTQFAAIYGIVFEDLNGDGVQNGTELGLSGVLIELGDDTSVSTSLYGGFTLSTTQFGGQVVSEFDPGGYFSTSPNQVHLDVVRGRGYRVDFGDAPVDSDFAAVYGTVFDDADGDGVQDPSETGLADVPVRLQGSSLAFTGPYGGYTFSTTTAGRHSLIETDPAGYFSTTPNQIRLDADLNQGYQVDFGDAAVGSGFAAVYGTVFEDANGNGQWDIDESGIRQVTVTLDGRSTSTNFYGNYTLSIPTPGRRTVREFDPEGYFSTTPNDVILDLALDQGYQVDFGDALQNSDFAILLGTVFEDADGDGQRDVDETGLADVPVRLDGVLTATTDASGNYFFKLGPGIRTLVEIDPPGYFSSTPNRVNLAVERGADYQLDFGDALTTSNFGAVYGIVFEDLNGDGLQNDDETGLDNVTVELEGPGGLNASTSSGPYGTYHFSTSLSGTYALVESNPPAYFSTTPDRLVLSLEPGGDRQLEFGDAPAESGFAALYGVVFDDVNGDGRQGRGELGLSGVSLSLSGLATATTGPYGGYTFSKTQAGPCSLVEADPPGYFSTTPNTLTLSLELGNGYPLYFGDASLGAGFAIIRGVVFEDLDGDGRPDFGEAGLSDVTVRLDGGAVRYAHTDLQGVYHFSTTLSGTHALLESDPGGYFSTTSNQVVLDVAPGRYYPVDFGDAPAGSGFAAVYGTVFQDHNGNGEQDTDEVGIQAVPVSLDRPGANDDAQAVTDRLGRYTFSTTPLGPHTVLETDPPGHLSTSPNRVYVSVDWMDRGYQVDFGDVLTDSFEAVPMYGTVFNDANQNGVRDPGELGLRDVNVSLDGFYTETTDLLGRYSFATSLTGPHVLFQADLDGYISTSPNTVTLVVRPGSEYELDFGDWPDYGQLIPIYGAVFKDQNGNGYQDGEPGLAGVRVTLNMSNTVLATATTDLYGIYIMSTSQSSTYSLVEADSPYYFSTTPNSVTLPVSLGNHYQVNFGDAPLGSGFAALYGVVFEDVNENGVQDGEPGIRGVQVSLDGQTVDRTDRHGCYTLSTTVPGAHTLLETDPKGYLSSTPNEVALVVEPDAGYQVDFGDFLICTCPPDGYEQDDLTTQASRASFGLSHTHDFCDDPTDWITFTAQASVIYTLTTSAWGQRTDTVLALFDGDGQTLLASNDDCPRKSDFSSCIIWQAPANGIYYVRSTNKAGLTGCYTDYDLRLDRQRGTVAYLPLVIRGSGVGQEATSIGSGDLQPPLALSGVISHTCPDAYEVDDTWQGANPIEPGQGQIHSFDSNPWFYAADKDFVRFELAVTRTVTFTAGVVGSSLVLSDGVRFELYDGDGNPLEVSGVGQLVWTAGAQRRYYLSASPRHMSFGCADEPGAGYFLLMRLSPQNATYLPVVLRQ